MIYFDNAATTKPCGQAKDAFNGAPFGNPSSLHTLGIESEKTLADAKNAILTRLGLQGELYFTSGATESNNMAIFGAVRALKRRGNKIVTTAMEHPSVYEPMKKLAENGFEVIFLKPADYDDFPAAIIENTDENTILVSCMAVNNETGFSVDIKRVYSGVKLKNPACLFHTDGVQGFCKVPLCGDLISLSAHKIHGFKGSGALYKAKDARIPPSALGGGQQGGFRSGTEAVELAAAFGAAAKAYPTDTAIFSKLKKRLHEGLCSLPKVYMNSDENCVDNIANFSVEGVKSEIMLHFLEERGIYLSAGSACSRGKVSPVLEALGFSRERADCALRASFCAENTEDEIDELVKGVSDGIERFRGKILKSRR